MPVSDVVGELCFVESMEHEAHDHCDDGGEGHAGQRYIAERQGHAGQAGDEDDRRQDHVAVLAVIDVVVDQNAQTGGADHAVQQEGDAADDRAGDGLDEGGERADERADDGDDCRAADDAHRVDLGDRHNADVLAVGGGRDRTDEAGDHGREVIREQRAVQAGVLEQIAADDLARDELMADVLVRDDEDDRQDDQDGVDVELRRLEVRNGDEAGVQRIDDGLGVDDAGNNARNVAADDRDQDRNGREEAAEHDAAEYRNGERHEKGDDRADGHAVADDAAGGSRRAGQLETDERDDRAHGCRRQHDVYPVRAAFVDDEREDAAARADCDEATERVLVAPVLDDDGRGCDEREGRAEVGRRLALGDQDEQQRADAVHEQHDRRVHLEDERHEHGCAEHREHMLDGQRHEQSRRDLVLDLNDSVVLHVFFFSP